MAFSRVRSERLVLQIGALRIGNARIISTISQNRTILAVSADTV